MEPENLQFWEETGKAIAYRNLSWSVFTLILSFMVWMSWSSLVVYLSERRPEFTESDLYWLTALPLLSAAFLEGFLSSLMRPLGHVLAKWYGSVEVTIWTFILMLIGIGSSVFFLPRSDYMGNFWGFLGSYLILFLGTGLGKGSTTEMITNIFYFLSKRDTKGVSNPGEIKKVLQKAKNETAMTLGFTSAIATFGAFFMPKIFDRADMLFGDIKFAMYFFGVFYAVCIVFTYVTYIRKTSNNPYSFSKEID